MLPARYGLAGMIWGKRYEGGNLRATLQTSKRATRIEFRQGSSTMAYVVVASLSLRKAARYPVICGG